MLRALTRADAAWLDSRLPAVASSAGFDGGEGTALLCSRLLDGPRLTARVIVRDGRDVGLLAYLLHQPRRDAAIIELVATPAANARRGSGAAAVALAEGELEAVGVHDIYAPAPAAHGIAMYFWIRLGYRPLLRPEWPCDREGVAWLRRTIEPVASARV